MEELLDLIQSGDVLIEHVGDKFNKIKSPLYGYISSADEELFQYGSIENKAEDINNNVFYKFIPKKYHDLNESLKKRIFDYNFNTLFYLKDNNIRFSDDVSKYRVWYWDIETKYSSDGTNKVENPKMPIVSISILDSIQKEYYVIAWHSEETADVSENSYRIEKDTDDGDIVNYIYVKNEYMLLKVFISLLQKYKPILLIGWFSNFYDFPYLIARLEENGIDTKFLSPLQLPIFVKKGNNNTVTAYIKGLYSIGLNEVIDSYSIDKFSSMGLDAVASKLNLGNKITIDLDNDYEHNFKLFMKYNINDVRLVYKIDKYYNLLPMLVLLHHLTGVSFKDILHTSKIVESALILNSDKAIIPTTRPFKNYQGAIVLNPLKSGLLKNVMVIDANSMYPTSTVTFNISPDTIICSYDDIKEEFRKFKHEGVLKFLEVKTHKKLQDVEHYDDIYKYALELLSSNKIDYVSTGYSDELNEKGYIFYHHNVKMGVFTTFLKQYYDLRTEYKAKKKKVDPSSQEYIRYSTFDMALKLVLNSTYGANGYQNFILYDPRIAESITFFARRLLEYAKLTLESKSYEVEYGDTDSLFVILKTQEDDAKKSNDEGNALNDEINSSIYDNHTKRYISTDLPQDLHKYLGFKLEHILHYVYFGNVKKRYYGLDYPDSKGVEKPYVRGMNVIRKDSPSLIKVILNDLINKIIHNTISLDDFNKAYDQILKAPLNQIGIIKSFNKQFDDYKVEPQHLKGLRFAQEVFHVKFNNTDNPFLFYVKLNKNINTYSKVSNVICLNESDLDKLTSQNILSIDYPTFFIKQILEPLEEFNNIQGLQDILYSFTYRFSNNVLQNAFNF